MVNSRLISVWFRRVPVVVPLRLYWGEFGADLWHGWVVCLLETIPFYLANYALYAIFATLCV